MLDMNYLEIIGFSADDIKSIKEIDDLYGKETAVLAEEYAKTLGNEPFVPYVTMGERELAHERGQRYAESVIAMEPDKQYILGLLAWLHLIPHLKVRYDELGIEETIFISTMKDILYKVEECKTMHGECGVFVDWFFLNFDLKLFEIGRLQFEAFRIPGMNYSFGDYTLGGEDAVYSCHIPSSGKLTIDACMESLQMAYEFFKPQLKDTVLPVFCHSWLLYEPYIEKVFPENSNLKKFAGLFDIYLSTTLDDFSDGWRVFGKNYEGSTKGLPVDNTLRKNFVEYIDGGGTFGNGRGIILYDGEQKKIINK